MGWAARVHKSKVKWGLMKSFCLSIDNLYTLRETVQSSPHPAADQRGYSSADLDSLDEVCTAIDGQIGTYRKLRRALTQSAERQLREIRKVEDRNERARLGQVANDDATERLDILDAEQHTDRRVVVSLEGPEMTWLQDNWKQRTDWNGADEWRARIRAITTSLKPENVLEWKPAEKETEPDVAAFDRPKANAPTPLHPNGHAPSAELSATVAG